MAGYRRSAPTAGLGGGRRAGPAAAATVLGVAGWAVLAGGYPSFSLGSAIAVLTPGVALFGYAVLTGPAAPRPARRVSRRGAVLWAVPVLAFSALEIVNDELGSTRAHPTLSVLADPVLAQHAGRSVAMGLWLAAGLALVRR